MKQDETHRGCMGIDLVTQLLDLNREHSATTSQNQFPIKAQQRNVQNSSYENDEMIQAILTDFEKGAKCRSDVKRAMAQRSNHRNKLSALTVIFKMKYFPKLASYLNWQFHSKNFGSETHSTNQSEAQRRFVELSTAAPSIRR
jgi:hypothetical protein